MTRALQKVFHVSSEGEALMIKKNLTKISLDKRMAKNGGKWFILTTKFYKSTNDAALLAPDNQNKKGKTAVEPEGTTANQK